MDLLGLSYGWCDRCRWCWYWLGVFWVNVINFCFLNIMSWWINFYRGNWDDYKEIFNLECKWEIEVYVLFFEDLRVVLGFDKLLFIVVFGCEWDLMVFIVMIMFCIMKVVDFINVMIYDFMNCCDIIVKYYSGV